MISRYSIYYKSAPFHCQFFKTPYFGRISEFEMVVLFGWTFLPSFWEFNTLLGSVIVQKKTCLDSHFSPPVNSSSGQIILSLPSQHSYKCEAVKWRLSPQRAECKALPLRRLKEVQLVTWEMHLSLTVKEGLKCNSPHSHYIWLLRKLQIRPNVMVTLHERKKRKKAFAYFLCKYIGKLDTQFPSSVSQTVGTPDIMQEFHTWHCMQGSGTFLYNRGAKLRRTHLESIRKNLCWPYCYP